MTSLSATPSAEPLVRRIGRLLGWLSLFATLALLSPGVVATANAEERAPAAGPSCQASASADEAMTFELARMVDRLRSHVEEREGGAGDTRSLNTRGFNYPTTSTAPPAERR